MSDYLYYCAECNSLVADTFENEDIPCKGCGNKMSPLHVSEEDWNKMPPAEKRELLEKYRMPQIVKRTPSQNENTNHENKHNFSRTKEDVYRGPESRMNRKRRAGINRTKIYALCGIAIGLVITLIVVAVVIISSKSSGESTAVSSHEQEPERYDEIVSEATANNKPASGDENDFEEFSEPLSTAEDNIEEMTEIPASVESDFERLPEWDDMSKAVPERIQIGDKMYSIEMTGAELLNNLETTSVPFDVSKDFASLLITPCYGEIRLSLNGETVVEFGLSSASIEQGTQVSVEDLCVYTIYISKSIRNYCRIVDGSKMDEIMGLSYDDILAKMNAFSEKLYLGCEKVNRFYDLGDPIDLENNNPFIKIDTYSDPLELRYEYIYDKNMIAISLNFIFYVDTNKNEVCDFNDREKTHGAINIIFCDYIKT